VFWLEDSDCKVLWVQQARQDLWDQVYYPCQLDLVGLDRPVDQEAVVDLVFHLGLVDQRDRPGREDPVGRLDREWAAVH